MILLSKLPARNISGDADVYMIIQYSETINFIMIG